jgi:hypothetical protein
MGFCNIFFSSDENDNLSKRHTFEDINPTQI